jgi:GDP-L-fucose synthase
MAEDILLSAKPEPTSLPYAIAKLAGTYMCLAYNKQYGDKRFIPVIPNNAYGPNDDFDPQSGHVLSALISRFHAAKESGAEAVTLWGSGSPRREFVHADDIADACLHLLQQDVSSLEFPLNIGAGSDISIKELADTIAGVVGYQGRLEWDRTRPDGAPRKLLDSTRLRAFGWEPKVSFDEGLRNTYEWYVQNAGNISTT